MGVIYKLKDEVVQFIISQRQSNPFFSCRQLAESASLQFGLRLSKSSVHDVLKESGVITPRGRKPKDKFQIPKEKKKQIQGNLSQVRPTPPVSQDKPVGEPAMTLIADVTALPEEKATQPPVEYEGAGRIFIKAALWDLGIFSEDNLKEADWEYYLTYCKGVKVDLENNKSFFIDLPLPLERCIREVADGVVNNVKPLIVHKVSDEGLLKAGMEAQPGCRIHKISIVDSKDHILFEFNDIMDVKRRFILNIRVFVENKSKNALERTKAIFFSQIIDNNDVIDTMLNLKGFDTTNNEENVVNIIIPDNYNNKGLFQEAVERLNGMYLRDEQNRSVKVKIKF